MNPNNPPEQTPAPGTKDLRDCTAAVLDSLIGRLKTNPKLTRPERGRPSVTFGEEAAYQLDHEKKLAIIATQLCQMPPDASSMARRQYFDRIRKAAKNYYKLLRTDYTSLMKTRVHQRIVWVPPNPNAVKSE